MNADEALNLLHKIDPMNESAYSDAVKAIEAELRAKDEAVEAWMKNYHGASQRIGMMELDLKARGEEIARLKEELRDTQRQGMSWEDATS